MQTILNLNSNFQPLKPASTTTSESQLPQKVRSETPGQTFTNFHDKRKGDLGELYVQLIATNKGAEVFPNLNCTGKTDLILKIGDQLVEIDVKMASWSKRDNNWVAPKASYVKLPVYPVIVIPEGDIMNWKIRWKNSDSSNTMTTPHCPPGLEDFWKKPPELKHETTN